MKLIAFLLAAAGAFAASPATALRCGRLLDVKSGQLRNDQVVLVIDGMVSKVGPASAVSLPAGAQSIDLTSATCLPGLADVHDHLTSSPAGGSGYQRLGIS